MSRRGLAGVLRQNAVYVRTISNGRVSSSEPLTAADWERLIGICFDNREADIGRFLRRNLGAIMDQLEMKPASPEPTPIELAKQFLEVGYKQFNASEGYPR
jgi:hypothetical protein